MILIESIGIIAAMLTTAAYFPQVIKTWKTRSTSDLSLPMYLMISLGTLLWLVYGILIANIPIMLANGLTALFSCVIFYFKLKERRTNS